jgi:hypothetical protein
LDQDPEDITAMNEHRDDTNTKIEIHGTKGMQNKPFRKTFKNQTALETWLDKNADGADDITILATRLAD